MKTRKPVFPATHLPSRMLPATQFPASVAESLPGVPLDPTRWRNVLFALLARYNSRHSRRNKIVSSKTMEERKTFLYAFFQKLRHDPAKTFRIDPRSLRHRHIEHSVRRWVADGQAPGTIQNSFSHLRAFSAWIGKPGLVLPAERYVEDPSTVTRSISTKTDKSWTGRDVDFDEAVKCVDAIDRYVGEQLRLMKPFGLRVKEAIMIRPHQCVVDGQLAATYACDAANYVEVVRGTKGGRRRLIPIDSDVKREALDRARRFVARTTDSMADPRLSLKQAYRHFYYVLGRAGLTRGQLGVTAHGLRHQYANDKYEGVTGEPSPVRGGEGTSERNATARTEIAADLGHSRLQITNAYVGRGKRGKVD